MRGFSDLVADTAALTTAEAALGSFAALTIQGTAILGIEKIAIPKIPVHPPLKHLVTITIHLEATVALAATLPETAAVAEGLSHELKILRKQIQRQAKEYADEDPEEENPDDESPKDPPEESEYPEEPEYPEESDQPEDQSDEPPSEESPDSEGPDGVGVFPPPPPPERPPPPPQQCVVFIHCRFIIICIPEKKCY